MEDIEWQIRRKKLTPEQAQELATLDKRKWVLLLLEIHYGIKIKEGRK